MEESLKLMLSFFMCLFLGLMTMWCSWWGANFLLVLVFVRFVFEVPVEEGVRVLGFNIYLDALSYGLCFLTLWLSVMMLGASNQFLKSKVSHSLFILLLLGLAYVLIISFLTSNYLMFYFFFEVSLVPTLMMITGWGFQPERLQAGIYLIMYTLTASLPLLMSIFFYYVNLGGVSMINSLSLFSLNYGVGNVVLALGLVLAFLVKMPMFLVHLWLPSAHVEAPVAGSMVLAGVLLKLGGYGICRVMGKWLSGIYVLSPYVIGLSLFGMVYVGVICCRANDMKALVAYSSVAHMGLVLGGLMSGYLWGLSGALAMMVSHGLSSSGLFCIVNLYYERTGSRSLFLNSGFMVTLPMFTLMMFLLCGSNVSAPPTINLMSEILLMSSVLSYDLGMMLVFPLGSFLGAVFTFYFFSLTQHGKPVSGVFNIGGPSLEAYHSLVLHLIPLNVVILKPEVFFVWL